MSALEEVGAYSKASDPISEFVGAMEAAGIRPVEPVSSLLGGGNLIRFQCEGDRPGKANGWAVLYLDNLPAGAFGNYRLGLSAKWRAGSVQSQSPAERRERAKRFREEQRRRAAARLEQQQNTAERCRQRWSRAGAADPTHAYLVAKCISGEGLRQTGDRLLVPMTDVSGALWNVQFIDQEGGKRFAKGGLQKGLFCLLGTPEKVLVITEGYGTGAVVRRATGHAVAVAFSSANLTATAIAMRSAYPGRDIIIAADDDPHLLANPRIKRNVGIEEARAAAAAVGGRLAVPPRKGVS